MNPKSLKSLFTSSLLCVALFSGFSVSEASVEDIFAEPAPPPELVETLTKYRTKQLAKEQNLASKVIQMNKEKKKLALMTLKANEGDTLAVNAPSSSNDTTQVASNTSSTKTASSTSIKTLNTVASNTRTTTTNDTSNQDINSSITSISNAIAKPYVVGSNLTQLINVTQYIPYFANMVYDDGETLIRFIDKSEASRLSIVNARVTKKGSYDLDVIENGSTIKLTPIGKAKESTLSVKLSNGRILILNLKYTGILSKISNSYYITL